MCRTIISLAFCLFHMHVQGQNMFRTACNGNLERLDSLLENTSINTKDERGRSLLHWAVACRKKEIFDYLIKRRININTPDNQAQTPMHVAVRFNNEEYLSYLIDVQPDTAWPSIFGASLLERAVFNKNVSMIKKLVTNGVNINAVNKRGSTALEIAKRIGALDLSQDLISLGADTGLVRVFKMEGKYMGQPEPGITPKMFAPNFISTEEQEFGAVFNKEGTAFYFGVDVGGRNEIRYSTMKQNQWTQPMALLTHEKYSYNDPFLSNDQNRLFFISQRALDGIGKEKDIDIWYVHKIDDGWSEPINAGSNINTPGNEYYISFTNDGTMYFASNGHPRKDTSRTDHDIYYAKYTDHTFQKPVALDSSVNTTAYEADVFISPDESYLIFCSTRKGGFGRGDLYISFKNPEGKWTRAVNMGDQINSVHYEYCPFVTQDGRFLFYTSNQDIYWVSTQIIDNIRQNMR